MPTATEPDAAAHDEHAPRLLASLRGLPRKGPKRAPARPATAKRKPKVRRA